MILALITNKGKTKPDQTKSSRRQFNQKNLNIFHRGQKCIQQ